MFRPEEMGEIIDGHTLRFVRTVKHSRERVWRAITDQREISAWMRYPVTFEGREGGRAQWFGDGEERIDGKVFIFDPPTTLAFSFYTPEREQAEAGLRQWSVRYDLEAAGDACRITFTHRLLPGAVIWGVGEGWHLFLDQLVAFLNGTLEDLPVYAGQEGEHPAGAQEYRVHVSNALLDFGRLAADRARDALASDRREDVAEQVERLALAMRQLHRIARQTGVRPDYSQPDSTAVDL